MESPASSSSSSLSNTSLSLSLVVCLILVPFCSASREIKDPNAALTHHDGPLHVSLAVLWYGRFKPVEKAVFRSFIKSIAGTDRSSVLVPDVVSWWKKVESYLSAANTKKSSKVRVGIEREVDDQNASLGSVVTANNIPSLLETAKAKAIAGLPKNRSIDVFVIFAAKDVAVEETCKSTCYLHGVLDKQLYILVPNPEHKCPAVCATPFHQSKIHTGPPLPFIFQPPSGNMGADSMIIHFASALAETVANPFNTGFFGSGKKKEEKSTEVTNPCAGLYARGGFPGYPGNVLIDPITGGAFNAHGVNGTKFLLPALWDPKTSSCWTTL